MPRLPLNAILAVILIASVQNSYAQAKGTGTISGRIIDSASARQDMSQATVAVTPTKDSTATQFVFTNKQGAFNVRNLKDGDYRLVISFQGYRPIVKRFTISPSSQQINLGALSMKKSSDELATVIVEAPPMRVKNDTVEYSASMYTTKPNAVVEDLLKKFPGIQVDASGNITAQGETVQRVLVDGKRFFSDDPKLATRNLPPDVIDKIQVFDDLDDQSKFSGFDNGNRIKTLNITTKKDKKKGNFGKAVAGAGTDGDYDLSLNMHRFNDNEQMSLLAQGNDVNKQNFTIQDILGNSGGRRGGGGPAAASNQSSPGVTTVWAAGGNYKNSWGTKTDLSGSYFYDYQHIALDQQNQQVKYQGNNTLINNSSSSSFQRTNNQRLNMNLEHYFDSSNSFIFRPNIVFQSSAPNSTSSSSQIDQNNNPLYSTSGYSSSKNSGFNVNGSNLTLRHKFKKQYRTLSLDLSGNVNTNNGNGYNYSVNKFNSFNKIDTLNQYYNDSLHSYNISPTLSYTEPVGKNQVIELNYNYNYSKSNTINNTYNFTDPTHGFQSFDSLFSNSYKFVSNSNRFSLNYRIQNPKFNLNMGSGLQFLNFNSYNSTKDITVAHNYVNLTPRVFFNYSFSKTQRLRVFYRGSTGTPSASQLQPLVTTSDSINYTIGNPDLKPQFTHSLRVLYSSFNPTTQRVMFATVNASTTVNDIQSKITYNSYGGQTNSYVNLNGTYNLSGYFNYGFALKKPKSNLNFSTNINYSQSQTLVDTARNPLPTDDFQHSYTRNTTLGETVSWTTNIKKNFDMNFSYAPSYFISKNSLRSASSQNQDYFTHKFVAEITAFTNSGWLAAANFSYAYTNNQIAAYNASIPLFSPSIAKSLFKKKNGEIRLSVFDLFNSNTYVNKSASGAGYNLNRSSTLTRYTMLTFTWNLNKFPGSQQQGRMPGMFNNFRRGGGGGGMRGGDF